MSTALAADLAGALDSVVLARRAGGFEPDSWQRTVLRSDADRVLLNCCRQSGKSTIAALVGLHTALYSPGSLILLVSPSERQSKELFRKVVDAYRKLGRPVSADAENRLSLELANGSRIVTLPGSEGTVRGYSGVKLIVIDEAARRRRATITAFAMRPKRSESRLRSTTRAARRRCPRYGSPSRPSA